MIVLADWRGDALPKEANKLRPAVVVEENGLFVPDYSNAILVPLSDDSRLIIQELALMIQPTPENGCTKPCWAVSHMFTTTSKARLTGTKSHVTAVQLMAIRRQIALAIGLDVERVL